VYKLSAAVNRAAIDIIQASTPQDEAFIVNFSDEAFLDQDFTSNLDLLRQGLSNIALKVERRCAMRSSLLPTTWRNRPSINTFWDIILPSPSARVVIGPFASRPKPRDSASSLSALETDTSPIRTLSLAAPPAVPTRPEPGRGRVRASAGFIML
jgi:hypothetical protein